MRNASADNSGNSSFLHGQQGLCLPWSGILFTNPNHKLNKCFQLHACALSWVRALDYACIKFERIIFVCNSLVETSPLWRSLFCIQAYNYPA